ncbi:hypothetical protein BGZ65_002192 [Modicella reniformis]|uniref:Uncharacterized protein n=1 Tax=Modicella reniformis TaxID=1440133 RepID=A0A9P6ILL4_9FUNG|nr:hypothetical protein BGZ65_002192 [Modicella reniformis]
MESKLPSLLRGEDASVRECSLKQEEYKVPSIMTNHDTYKRRVWDTQKVMGGKYDVICDRLIEMVEASVGQKRDTKNKVAGNGLGEFSTNSNLGETYCEEVGEVKIKITSGELVKRVHDGMVKVYEIDPENQQRVVVLKLKLARIRNPTAGIITINLTSLNFLMNVLLALSIW